jgi:hypothetical protein
MPFEWYASAPGMHVEISRGDFNASRGFNGAADWSMNVTETGFRQLSGADLAAQRCDADFYPELKPKELYPTMTVAGIVNVGHSEKLFSICDPALLVRRWCHSG